jgi:hypothetical protein
MLFYLHPVIGGGRVPMRQRGDLRLGAPVPAMGEKEAGCRGWEVGGGGRAARARAGQVGLGLI